MRKNPLLQKLKQGKTTYGVWVTLESPNVTEALVELGIDWVVIETEHGHLDWRDVASHIRVCSESETAALVRVSETQRTTIQRALDLRADGLILPMIGSAEELETAYQLGRFPPRGVRGVGGERSVKWGLEWQEYLGSADEETLLIPLLETRQAVENSTAILNIEGLQAVFFGPADMSASYGYLGEWEGPGVAEAILDIRGEAEAKEISAGVLGRTPEEVALRREQGFRMIGLGADVNLMLRSVQETLGFSNGEG